MCCWCCWSKNYDLSHFLPTFPPRLFISAECFAPSFAKFLHMKHFHIHILYLNCLVFFCFFYCHLQFTSLRTLQQYLTLLGESNFTGRLYAFFLSGNVLTAAKYKQRIDIFICAHVSKCTFTIHIQSIHWHSGVEIFSEEGLHTCILDFATKTLSWLQPLQCLSLICATRFLPESKILSKRSWLTIVNCPMLLCLCSPLWQKGPIWGWHCLTQATWACCCWSVCRRLHVFVLAF